jgi:hypothetical protein
MNYNISISEDPSRITMSENWGTCYRTLVKEAIIECESISHGDIKLGKMKITFYPEESTVLKLHLAMTNVRYDANKIKSNRATEARPGFCQYERISKG